MSCECLFDFGNVSAVVDLRDSEMQALGDINLIGVDHSRCCLLMQSAISW